MTDERRGMTSASAADRHRLCPGSFLMERGKPEISTPDSERGTRIHTALATGIPPTDPEEAETYSMCEEVEAEALARWGEPARELREMRLWESWSSDGREYDHSGKADRIYTAGSRARVSDFKTGRNEPPESGRNQQLRDLACLLWLNEPLIDEITVEIIQPWVTRSPVPCLYIQTDLARATLEMQQRVEESWKGGPRIPGAHCGHCKGKQDCPEFLSSGLPVVFRVEPPFPSEEQIAETLSLLSPEKLGFGYGMAKLLEAAFEAEVRLRLGDGRPVDGWRLAPGREREKIVDPQRVFERFIALGGSQSDFMEAVTVAKGKLENALRELTGAKGAALKADLSRLLEGATESKTTAEILERT